MFKNTKETKEDNAHQLRRPAPVEHRGRRQDPARPRPSFSSSSSLLTILEISRQLNFSQFPRCLAFDLVVYITACSSIT